MKPLRAPTYVEKSFNGFGIFDAAHVPVGWYADKAMADWVNCLVDRELLKAKPKLDLPRLEAEARQQIAQGRKAPTRANLEATANAKGEVA